MVLTYRETLAQLIETSSDLVLDVFSLVKSDQVKAARFEVDCGIRESLMEYLHNYTSRPVEERLNKNAILKEVKFICRTNEYLYEAFVDQMDDLDEKENTLAIIALKGNLHAHINDKKIANRLNKAAIRYMYERHTIKDMGAFFNEFITDLRDLTKGNDGEIKGRIRGVRSTDEDSFIEVLDDASDTDTGVTGIKFGWQWFEKMFGHLGRGDFFNVSALPNNYKSGLLLSLFGQAPIYTKPVMKDPNKKPAVVFWSFEDSIEKKLNLLYRARKFNDGERVTNINATTSKEKYDYLRKVFGVNGYEFIMEEFNPKELTFMDLFDHYNRYEAEGFEIHLLTIDYLLKMPTTGCDNSMVGNDVVDLYERMKAFLSSKGCAYLNAHQLGPGAKRLLSEGIIESSFVKQLVGKGFYDKSSKVNQIFDKEVFTHKITHEGKSYLSVGWGKLRDGVTPDNAKYFLLPFPQTDESRVEFPIPDDVGKEPIHLTRLYTESADVDSFF